MATPSYKAPGINDLLDHLSGTSRVQSITSDVCVFCQTAVGEFDNALSQKEFTISGMCQTCQNDFFNPDDDDESVWEDEKNCS